MKESRLAGRYAKALFDLAQEKKETDRIFEDMKQLHRISQTNRDFVALLKNPVINPDKKNKVFRAIFENYFHPLSLSFLSIILKKNREAYVKFISGEFITLYKEYKNIKTAYLYTAAEASNTIKQEIIKILEEDFKAEIELISETNPELIGGFIIKVDDKQLDASIQNKLKQLSKEFKENIYIKKY